MRFLPLYLPLLLLGACAGKSGTGYRPERIGDDPHSPGAQREMCFEEHHGLLRLSRAALEELCPKILTQTELICLRFAHSTRDWRKACPGVDTPDKLECISTIQNGASYALLESLEKCRTVRNRRQVLCLSRAVARSGVPLQPETVQECLDRNGD